MDRRCFLAGAAVATALPGLVRASIRIGDTVLTSVSDGSLVLPDTFYFQTMPQDALAEIRQRHGITGSQISPPCNVTLLQTPERVVLFDVGSGAEFMPSAGALLVQLDDLGLAAEDVTDVVFTHGHPDHLWGLLDDFGDLAFARARYHMGQAEFDYWMHPDTVSTIGEARTAFAVGAERRLALIGEQVRFFKDGEEIMPGVAARATYGHSPGHMAFEVRAGSEAVMVLGDAIANHHVAFERPDWLSGADQDPERAASTRIALLDQLAQEQMRILGYHLPGGGFGRVARRGDAYQFVVEDL